MDEDKIADAGGAGKGEETARASEPEAIPSADSTAAGERTATAEVEPDAEVGVDSDAESEVDPDTEAAEPAAPAGEGDPSASASSDGEGEGEETTEPSAATAPPLGDAAYAHAPTAYPALPLGDAAEEDPDEPAETTDTVDDDEDPEDLLVTAGLDRRRDFFWWLLTPVIVMVLGPMLAGSVAFLVAEADTGYPAICRAAAPDNRCEEVILRMAAQHTAAFLIGWLLIWTLPWWRGLRPYRIGFAVFVVLVLVAAPLRLLSSLDYQTVMGR